MYYDQLARGFGFKKQQLDVGDLKGKFWVRTASVNKVADDNDPAIDQILNILRHRSDAAAWFVEGGKATRDKLKEPKPKKTAKKPPKYVTNEEGQRIPYPVNWGAFDPSVYSEGYAPPSPTRTDIAMVIQELIKKYDDTPYSINNGYCQEFAEDLVKLVRGAEHFEVGGSWVEENIDEPAHSFVKFEGRYYDAEAPQGVRDWHNLPVFHNLTGKENAYKLHLKKLQEGKFSAAKKASEEDYCMVEGCGIWAVDFARKNGGEICILSADYGEEWSDEIPYEITHAFVKKDGKTFDAGGQRSADEMAKELNVTLYSIKGPWLPDEFEAKFMGDTDDKPLFGKTAAKLYPATDEWVGRAKDFLKEKWAERHLELGREGEPMDIKGACKFASLFAQALFGGQIRGNADHQLLKTPDRIIDLTDLWDSGTFYHDKGFFGNPEHAESMASCEPRVRQWVEEFGQRYGIDKVAGFGKKADMGRVMQQFPDLGEEIPEAGLIPEKGQYAAIRTSDGQIFADPDWERNTHISFIRRMGIPPDKVEDGGWLIDGVYEPTIRSDAGNYGARARALLNTRKALKAEGKTASKQAGFSKKADTDILVGDGESNAYGNVIPIDELGEWAAMLMPGATRGIAKLTRLLKEHKKIGTLEGIEVSEEKRGQGLGKALLYDFIAEAKKLGATAVVAVVDTAGKQREGFDLIGWYKGQGFKPVPITGAIFPVMVRDLTSKLPKTPTEKARSDSRQTSMLGKPHEDELQDTYAKPKIPFKASLLKE